MYNHCTLASCVTNRLEAEEAQPFIRETHNRYNAETTLVLFIITFLKCISV